MQARHGARSSTNFPKSGWDKVMDLNVKSVFFLTKALAKPLRAAASHERPAKVINIASVDGIFVNPGETYSYAASKAAVIHLTRRMATKLVKDSINVTAIAPGAFKSDMNRAARDHSDEVAKRIPAQAHRNRRGHGGDRDLSRLARGRLCRRQHHRGRWRRGLRERGA